VLLTLHRLGITLDSHRLSQKETAGALHYTEVTILPLSSSQSQLILQVPSEQKAIYLQYEQLNEKVESSLLEPKSSIDTLMIQSKTVYSVKKEQQIKLRNKENSI